MIFKHVVIFGIFFQLGSVSLRGVRSDKDHFFEEDDFQNGGEEGREKDLLVEKVKPLKESMISLDQEAVVNGGDARRKFINGRSGVYGTNTTADFVQVKENGTWNLEKKEKNLDLGKEIIKPPIPCPVNTEDLVATAQASVSRALKGFCSTKEMEEKFGDLEKSIVSQLSVIKNLIVNLEDRLGEHGDSVIYGQKQLSAAINKGCAGSANGNGGILSSASDVNNKNQKPAHDYQPSKIPVVSNDMNGGDADSDEDSDQEDTSGPRDLEILKFNSSIHMETNSNNSPKKVFTYYWKIKGMKYKLTGWNPRKSLRSPSFYIFPRAYRMYMRVYPRHNEDVFNVRVGLTKGEFDDSLKWPFPLKHKIHILDQTEEGRLFEDIASLVWNPNLLCSDSHWQKPVKGDNTECVEVGFPHEILKLRKYIRNDALVIKLTVYLES